jgi:integrase
MPMMPAKGLDAFVRNLTWDKAVRTVEREHRARNDQRRANGEPEKPLKPPRQITYLNYIERGLSLMLIVSYGGTMRFRALTYRDGQPHYWKLGTYPQMSVRDARAKAQEYFKDPNKIEAKAAVGTFKEVAENWFKRHVEKQGLISAPEIRRQLNVYIYPKWANTKFDEIRRGTVAKLLDDIEEEHTPAMADYILATLRSIMTWHQSRDENYVSLIVKGMRRNKAKKARERILTDNELRRVWQAAGECGTFGAWLKFALLTAQRKEKIKTMRWDDIADDEWTIRTEQREKGTAGVLRLPQLALDVIEDQRQRRIAGNPYVFAGSLRGRRRASAKKPGLPTFNSFSKAKADLDTKLSDLPDWTLHDLRRTARSLMSRAGVPSDHAERVLGHAIAGVEGVYDRHRYFDEKAEALNRLAHEVENIISPPPANVVALPKRKRPRR